MGGVISQCMSVDLPFLAISQANRNLRRSAPGGMPCGGCNCGRSRGGGLICGDLLQRFGHGVENRAKKPPAAGTADKADRAPIISPSARLTSPRAWIRISGCVDAGRLEESGSRNSRLSLLPGQARGGRTTDNSRKQ